MNTTTPTKEKFETYALVELFGHARIVGLVTEQEIGGASFIRVDVPGPDGATAFTRIYGAAAIYSLSPITKDVAVELAKRCDAQPVRPYELPQLRDAERPGDDEDSADDDDETPM